MIEGGLDLAPADDRPVAGDTIAGVYEEYQYKNGTLTLPVADIPVAKPKGAG